MISPKDIEKTFQYIAEMYAAGQSQAMRAGLAGEQGACICLLYKYLSEIKELAEFAAKELYQKNSLVDTGKRLDQILKEEVGFTGGDCQICKREGRL